MIKNQFSKKNCKNFRINPEEATVVVWVLPQDLRIYDRLDVGLVLWYFFISSDFVFWFMLFFIMKSFRKFGDRVIVLTSFLFVSGKTDD